MVAILERINLKPGPEVTYNPQDPPLSKMTSDEAIYRWGKNRPGVWEFLTPFAKFELRRRFLKDNDLENTIPNDYYYKSAAEHVNRGSLSFLKKEWHCDYKRRQKEDTPQLPNIMFDNSLNAERMNLKAYLWEIEDIPRLKDWEEIDLSKCIWAARTQGMVDKAAERKLIEGNYGLVISQAKKRLGQGVSFVDLIQAGNNAVVEKTPDFDYRRGYKFSTFITWWIRGYIGQVVEHYGSIVKLPLNLQRKIWKLKAAERKFYRENCVLPTIEEQSLLTGFATGEIQMLIEAHSHTQPLSLNMPIKRNEENSDEFENCISDSSKPTVEDIGMQAILAEEVDKVLKTLTEQERRVLRLRFGLEDGEKRTLEEIGREFKVTKEAIRQIEAKALMKLRHPSRAKYLKDDLD